MNKVNKIDDMNGYRNLQRLYRKLYSFCIDVVKLYTAASHFSFDTCAPHVLWSRKQLIGKLSNDLASQHLLKPNIRARFGFTESSITTSLINGWHTIVINFSSAVPLFVRPR